MNNDAPTLPHGFRPCVLTPAEQFAIDTMRVRFISSCGFYSYFYISSLKEFFTHDVPWAATDGRNVFLNPTTITALSDENRVFVLAHEVEHAVRRHCQRAAHYRKEGTIQGLPYDHDTAGRAMDYTVNAGLIEDRVGVFNQQWLIDQRFSADDLWEDVYTKLYDPANKGGGGKGSGPGGRGKNKPGQTPFDQHLEPPVDPVTGEVDEMSDMEYKEAITRAYEAAKIAGNLPGHIKRFVESVLEPQIDWRSQLRLLVTANTGQGRDSWERPNRRRLCLNPIIITPGRSGYGADTIAVAVDCSGSVDDKELSAYFGELEGIIADVRPRNVVLIWCDAKVQRVDEATTMDDLTHIRQEGAPGGGGTSFIPPFAYLAENGIRPDTMVYLTDMYGSFPDNPPAYPVVWCATSDIQAPFGSTIRIKV